MSALLVEAPGLFTTVQDLGREGFGPMGVSASGAADAISLRIGNRLVGNSDGAAALEMTLIGGAFTFERAAVIAVTGADFGPSLDGVALPMWTSIEIREGQTLKFGPSRSGARAYLCVQGGIAVELFLGSASTHVLSGLGGFEGRALRKGDRVELGATNSLFRKRVAIAESARKPTASQGDPNYRWAAKRLVRRIVVENVLRECISCKRTIESHGYSSGRSANFARHLARDDYRGSLAGRDSGALLRASRSFYLSNSKRPAAILKSRT